MRNKLLLSIFTILLAAAVTGCGTASVEDMDSLAHEQNQSLQPEEYASVSEEKQSSSMEAEVAETAELSFAVLAKRQFGFSSGAGGWSEEFTIEKDGYFTGNYHDSDMGDVGEGYADGTIYSSSYSGHFEKLTKINDYTYEMKLKDISYKETPDTVEIRDNIRYIYTGAYCLGGTDTFRIYLPGTPLSELSEEVYFWISMMNQSETELTMIAIVDESNGYGIYSHDRAKPLDDARTMLENCQYSYDYYDEKLSQVMTTLEMVEYSGAKYEVSDDCLNYIWNLIRYNVDEERFSEILAEQRAWIAEKESKAAEAASEYEGGSFAAVSQNDVLATLTMERCKELIAYLE